MKLVIGNKNYSSWSLRPWLAMRIAGITFEETRIALYESDWQDKIHQYSHAGKVPVLIDAVVTIWDSLAILEYIAERFPEKRLWPSDTVQRAHARAVSAEMHSGFPALRSNLCMNLRRKYTTHSKAPEVLAEIARVQEIWTSCIAASGGPFLFGAFCNADAMFAPVVTRFLTYAVAVSETSQGYMAAIRALPAMEEWYSAAVLETEILPQYEYQP